MAGSKKELYLKGISLIEDYFRKQGIEITIGFELEFLAPRPADETGKKFFGEVVKSPDREWQHLITDDKLADYLKQFRAAVRKFSKTLGGVINVIKEVPIDKYEAILCPMPATKAINAAEFLKTTILENMLPDLQANNWAEKISFGSYQDRITPALHTNIGMTLNGKEILKESNYAPSDFAIALAEGMKAAIHETTILSSPFPSGYDRYSSKAHASYPKKVAVNQHSYNKDSSCIGMKYREVEKGHCMYPKNGNGDSQYVHWIENRLPSGDCQPYVAAFTTLLAAFDAFRKIAKVNSNGDLQLENGQPQLRNDAMVERKDYEIPSDFQKARKVFAHGKIFESALNKLDPEGKLGTELFNLEIENQAKVRRKVKTLPTEAQNSTGAVRS